MNEIYMADVTEDFARCWNAAGLHIQDQAQGPLQSWLRAHLNPPFLEHLSFRLGNQLFFIQLEDVDGLLETPGSPDGLRFIAEGCAGHACVMPMRKDKVDWRPAEPGWGLLNASTREPICPPAFISDEKILMTDWEVQDLAVQVVRDELAKEGRELMSWNSNPGVNPSLWFVGDKGPEWVIVRAARYPAKTANLPSNNAVIDDLLNKLRYPGHSASVAVAPFDDPLDPSADRNGNVKPLFRGYGMHIEYDGLELLKP